jgi:hypothetical protein
VIPTVKPIWCLRQRWVSSAFGDKPALIVAVGRPFAAPASDVRESSFSKNSVRAFASLFGPGVKTCASSSVSPVWPKQAELEEKPTSGANDRLRWPLGRSIRSAIAHAEIKVDGEFKTVTQEMI